MNRTWTALVALVVSPVLVIGGLALAAAGYGSTNTIGDCASAVSSQPAATQPPLGNTSLTGKSPVSRLGDPCGPADDLGPAAALTGPDGYVDDPTSNGRITRRMLNIYNQVNTTFNGWPWGIGCWDRHEWNPTSDHPLGRACDFTVGHLGKLPDPTGRATGWRLANWARAYAIVLGIKYVIWDGRIWSRARAKEGWRQYDGGGIYDPESVTGSHRDHVHVSAS